MLLDNLRVFLTIAEKGSLVAAARESGLSSTTVSERLAALEAHYGVVLFNRTTRSISLTEEGRLLVDGAKNVLAEVSELDTRIRLGAATLSGPIRVSAPVDLGRGLASDVIDRFTRANPAVAVELFVSDAYVDLVGQGFDLAVRFGNITDTSLRTRSLGHYPRYVCASPDYLATHGTPERPEDLARHNCLVMRFGVALDNVWAFSRGGKTERIAVTGNRTANDGSLIRSWALAGHGIALKSELDVAADIQAGNLIPILSDFQAPAIPLQMLYPPARAQPKRVAAFADEFVRTLEERNNAVNAAPRSRGSRKT